MYRLDKRRTGPSVANCSIPAARPRTGSRRNCQGIRGRLRVGYASSIGVQGLIDAGSSSIAARDETFSRSWKVNITRGMDSTIVLPEAQLGNRALSTSGVMEQNFVQEGRIYSHLIDPTAHGLKTGQCARCCKPRCSRQIPHWRMHFRRQCSFWGMSGTCCSFAVRRLLRALGLRRRQEHRVPDSCMAGRQRLLQLRGQRWTGVISWDWQQLELAH